MLPISGAIGLAAGLAAGEAAKSFAKKRGWSPQAQDITSKIAHWAASSAAGSAVSNIIDPVTTVAHPVTTAPAGAAYHKEIMDFMNGRGRIPSLR
jgi:hypothetical protein